MDILLLSQRISKYTMRQKRNPRGEKSAQIIIYPKTGQSNGKTTSKRKKTSCRQTGGFANRYDFAYAGRDVNQVGKVTPKLLTQATGEINKIGQQRIDQVVRSGRVEIEQVTPKIIRGAIEEVYKTRFRQLSNLGNKQFRKIKRRLFK